MVTARLGDTRGLDVVDLGCGTGRHAAPLARAGARVTALDFADRMVARAKPGWERVRFIAHDLTQPLPLPDRSFDRVLSCLVIERLADVTSFFGECRLICREDGFILVSAMHPAMFLIGRQARFTDPATGRKVQPRSYPTLHADFPREYAEPGYLETGGGGGGRGGSSAAGGGGGASTGGGGAA